MPELIRLTQTGTGEARQPQAYFQAGRGGSPHGRVGSGSDLRTNC